MRIYHHILMIVLFFFQTSLFSMEAEDGKEKFIFITKGKFIFVQNKEIPYELLSRTLLMTAQDCTEPNIAPAEQFRPFIYKIRDEKQKKSPRDKSYNAQESFCLRTSNLHFAAKFDNLTEEQVLKCKDINKQDIVGKTPLLAAISAGKIQNAILLLNNKADLHVRDDMQDTAILLASHYGQGEIVMKLLSLGANILDEDEEMMTSIMQAGINGHREIVRIIRDWSIITHNRLSDEDLAIIERMDLGTIAEYNKHFRMLLKE